MTARRLTPALALAYLRELSIDVRAASVLDAAGSCLAGDARLGERARTLLAGAGEAPVVRVERAAGEVLVAGSAHGLAIAVVTGPHALLPLLEHDVRTLLADLAGVDPQR